MFNILVTRLILISIYCLIFHFLWSFTSSAQCNESYFIGEGTFYGYSGGGNCSFPTPYNSLYSAAVNAYQYTNARLCGACAEVTGDKGTIIVSLEDQCPECKHGDLDLEQEAFPFIDEPINGRVPIRWKIVPCPVSGPVSFYFKEGSSIFWTAVQVRNHTYPIAKVELLFNGSFIDLPREPFNYFIKPDGMGQGPYTFRITDHSGKSIIEENIPLKITTVIEGKNQFLPCDPMSVGKLHHSNQEVFCVVDAANGITTIQNKSMAEVNFKILNIIGEVISQGTIAPLSEIYAKSYTCGIYILAIHKDQMVYTQKLIY